MRRSCCPKKNTPICILCVVMQQYCHCRCWIVSATISSTTNLRSNYIHLCSTVPASKKLFPSANDRAERQVQRNLEEGETLLTWYREVHALVPQEFLPASMFRAKKSWESYHTQKDCIRTISSVFSILNLQAWLAGWHPAVWVMPTPKSFVTFYLAAKHILHTVNSTKPESGIH